VIVGVLIAAGVAVFNAGAAYGLAQSGALAERLGREAPRLMPWMWGGPHLAYGWGGRPFGGGFGFLGCLVPLFVFFLLFWLIRGAFGRGPWGWRHFGPGGRGDWEQHRQQMFEEWHRRAHEAAGPSAAQPDKPAAQ
jgi:hypothetical protein